jgi:hypothetical protein
MTPPLAVTTHAKSDPTDTEVTPLRPAIGTGTRLLPKTTPSGAYIVELPSGRMPPQHQTVPSKTTAQEEPPTETEVATLEKPVTCTGIELFVVELFPSWPRLLLPQHQTAPFLVTSQDWLGPTARLATVVVAAPPPPEPAPPVGAGWGCGELPSAPIRRGSPASVLAAPAPLQTYAVCCTSLGSRTPSPFVSMPT